MDDLKNWLDEKEPDYAQGLILLAKYGRNRILLQNLNRRQHMKKLRYELEKLFNHQAKDQKLVKEAAKAKKEAETIVLTPETKVEEVTPEKKVFRLKIVREDKPVKYDDLPDELKKVYDATVEKYKVQRSTHEKIKLMKEAKDEDRKPLVDELLKLDEEIRANWKVIDEWDGKTVENKGGENKGAQDVDEQVKKINSARKFISENKKKLIAAIEAKEEAKIEKLRNGIQERVDLLIKEKQNFKDKVISDLEPLGIKFS